MSKTKAEQDELAAAMERHGQALMARHAAERQKASARIQEIENQRARIRRARRVLEQAALAAADTINDARAQLDALGVPPEHYEA